LVDVSVRPTEGKYVNKKAKDAKDTESERPPEVILDGGNVAHSHTAQRVQKEPSGKGIVIAYEYYKQLGYSVKVIIEGYFLHNKKFSEKVVTELDEVKNLKPDLVSTPPAKYGDDFWVSYALKHENVVVVTNDGLSDFIKEAEDEETRQKYIDFRNNRLIQFTFVGDEFCPDSEFKMPEIPEDLSAVPKKAKEIPVAKTEVVAAPAPPVKKEQKKPLDYNAVDKKWFKKTDETGRVHASIAGQIANSVMGSRTLKHTKFKNLKKLVESSEVLSKKWVQNETHYIQRLNFKPEIKTKKTPPAPTSKAPDKKKSIKILRKAIREIVDSPISIVTFNNKLKDYLVANDYPEPRPKSLYRDCGFPLSANTITVLEAHAKDLITWQIPIDPKTGSAAINKTTLQLARRATTEQT
jgi:hypothetical protein